MPGVLRAKVGGNWVDISMSGPPGPPGGTHVHVQGTPLSTWIIDHALGYQPNVTVVDSAESQVEGDITYMSGTQIRIIFSGAFSGKAYLS